MRASSVQRILAELPDDAVVVDIGGWGKPFPRADWVIDLMPYETRGVYGYETHDPERFTKDTWIQRDICDKEPLPFEDASVDFVTCSHTLEDIRDPIWVCREMQRIGRAGYIETPSRLEEQTAGVQGPWVGWGHHRWLVEEVDGELVFTFKHHVMCGREHAHLPAGFLDGVDPDERTLAFWWEGGFTVREQVLLDAESLDPYLEDFVATELSRRPDAAPRGVVPTAVTQLLGRGDTRRRRLARAVRRRT